MKILDKNKLKLIENWINALLKKRISNEIFIKLNRFKEWQIGLKNENLYFIFPLFENFYKVGYQANLPCSIFRFYKIKYIKSFEKLYAPGLEKDNDILYTKKDDILIFLYDVPGLIFWILSRSEEVNINSPRSNLDIHGRFSPFISHAYLNNYLNEPIVDQWICILRECINFYFPRLKLIKHYYSLQLSHDVDRPSKYKFESSKLLFKHILHNSIKKPSIKELTRLFKTKFSKKITLHKDDPYNTFDWLLKVNLKHNIKSIFYFVFRNKIDYFDVDYNYSSPIIGNLISKIIKNQQIIGLHSSYRSQYNFEILNYEVKKYKKILKLNNIKNSKLYHRSHYLRWQTPNSARNLDKFNFQYDSTQGYSSIIGFRCGTSFPFKMIDPITKENLNIIEKPLIIMENAITKKYELNDEKYVENNFIEFERIKEKIKKVEGEFNLLWHNCSLVNDQDKILYESIIKNF
tara:strand:+ start:1200 stop:2585 length:1386 start_codon:yes stop_codon:yes gene_type:complete